MTLKQVVELDWDIMLPLSLDEALNALETEILTRVLDNLKVESFSMYLALKRLDAGQVSEETEGGRLDVLPKLF
jgi:glutamine synthetase